MDLDEADVCAHLAGLNERVHRFEIARCPAGRGHAPCSTRPRQWSSCGPAALPSAFERVSSVFAPERDNQRLPRLHLLPGRADQWQQPVHVQGVDGTRALRGADPAMKPFTAGSRAFAYAV